MSTEVLNRYSIKLSGKLATQYEQQAAAQGKSVEDVIADRLAASVDMDVSKGRSIRLEPADRQAIEAACSRSFATAKDLVHFLSTSFKLSVNNADVILTPELLRRLEARCGRVPFREFVNRVVRDQLEHYVGLR